MSDKFSVVCNSCGEIGAALNVKTYSNDAKHIEAVCRGCDSKGLIKQNKGSLFEEDKNIWGDFVLYFGKYSGECLDDIYETDADYLRWFANNVDSGGAVLKVRDFLEYKEGA